MINTKLLMILTVAFLAICGALLQFVPHETLTFLNIEPNATLALCLQIVGALYLGFAMMNWMAKSLVIGGIYARPLAMGNLVHFLVGGLALIKSSFGGPSSWPLWVAAILYSLFAIAFTIVLFTPPRPATDRG